MCVASIERSRLRTSNFQKLSRRALHIYLTCVHTMEAHVEAVWSEHNIEAPAPCFSCTLSIAIACFEISFMAFQNTPNFEVTHDGYRVTSVAGTHEPHSDDGSINGTITGQLTGRTGTIFQFFRSLYADDGAFMFSSRDDMINGMSLLCTCTFTFNGSAS